jgi:hypothetical protein
MGTFVIQTYDIKKQASHTTVDQLADTACTVPQMLFGTRSCTTFSQVFPEYFCFYPPFASSFNITPQLVRMRTKLLQPNLSRATFITSVLSYTRSSYKCVVFVSIWCLPLKKHAYQRQAAAQTHRFVLLQVCNNSANGSAISNQVLEIWLREICFPKVLFRREKSQIFDHY